jgi:dipeptidyl aminopeptidase/acylaminoacyl peptidase
MLRSAQQVSFESAGRTLRGTLIRPATTSLSNPALIFVHGWKSSQHSYLARAEGLADDGFIGLAFDLHGHGESDGHEPVLDSSQTKAFLADVIAAYDFLVRQDGVDPQRIGLVGASFGAYLAVWLATQRQVRWLALRAPTDRQDGQLGPAASALARFDGDLLVVESEFDDVIPHDVVVGYTRALANPARVTYEVIPDAVHELREPEWRARFIDILRRWFRGRLAATH